MITMFPFFRTLPSITIGLYKTWQQTADRTFIARLASSKKGECEEEFHVSSQHWADIGFLFSHLILTPMSHLASMPCRTCCDFSEPCILHLWV